MLLLPGFLIVLIIVSVGVIWTTDTEGYDDTTKLWDTAVLLAILTLLSWLYVAKLHENGSSQSKDSPLPALRTTPKHTSKPYRWNTSERWVLKSLQ